MQFALIPALHLAAIATKGKELHIAYTVLGRILAGQIDEEQHQTSLLLLNTVRQHLESSLSISSRAQGKTRHRSQGSGEVADPLALKKTILALRSLIAGVPAGPDIFPALYNPVSQLCHYPDEGVQQLALDVLGKIHSYLDHDEGLSKAIWERVRGLIRSYTSKRSGKSRAASESLAKALLRATRQAVLQGVLSGQVACESVLLLIDAHHSPAVSIACLKFCVDMASTEANEQVTLESLWRIASEICELHPSSYSVLLSGASILGRLALLNEASPTTSAYAQPVWIQIKSHLSAKNANRKLLLLGALEAFLPFEWYNAGNAAGLKLEEPEMSTLLAMLGDKDESIRIRVSDDTL